MLPRNFFARFAAIAVTATLLQAACSARTDDPITDRSFPKHRDVAHALAGTRPYVARLSGSAAWSPCVSTDTIAPTVCDAPPHTSSIVQAGNVFSATTADAADADVLWSAALLDLASKPVERRLDAIVRELTTVVERSHLSAAARNDLAVAYLARYGVRHDRTDMLAAFDQIEHARETDSRSSVIAFNRALILERLHLYEEAAAAWTQLVAADSSGPWAAEARQHHAALREAARTPRFHYDTADVAAAVRGDRQGAREYVLDHALDEWTAATRRHDRAAARGVATTIAAIGTAIAHDSGDSSVAHIARALTTGASSAADGVGLFVDGSRLFRQGNYGEAAPKLDAAVVRLRTAGAAPLADWAEVLSAGGAVLRAAYADADVKYAAAERRAALRGDLALRARLVWGLGLSAALQGRTAQSLDRYTEAGRLFQRIGERTNEGSMLSQRADVLFLLGRDDDAIDAKLGALAALDARRDPATRAGPLLALARQLNEIGFPAAGLAVLREAVTSAENSTRLSNRAQALVRLADAEFAAGSRERGAATFAKVRTALASLTDTVTRARLAMELASTEATMLETTDPRRATAWLDSASAFFRRRRILFSLPRPLIRAATLRLKVADTAGARRNLDEAVATIDALAAAPSDPAGLRALAASRHDVYAEQVALQLAAHDTAHAFLLAERGRGNSLAAVPRLEPGRVVIAYATLSNDVVAWILRDSSMRLVRPIATTARLRDLARRFEDLTRLGADSAAWSATSAELYDMLIAPAARELREARELTVVADGALSRLPFAGLRSRRGEYLIRQVALTVSSGVRPNAPLPRTASPVVVVGNPSFDQQIFADLAPLRGAAREAHAVAAAYPASVSFGDAEATRTRVLAALRSAGTFHFAGHARLVDRAPSLSHLVLARTTGQLDANSLAASDIEQLDLRRLRLVVLSSCGTAQARSRRDETMSGLSNAFLNAGAGAVISSLWEADDDATTALMEKLHARLAAGETPAAALRGAQLSMIDAPATSNPRYWSAFLLERR